MANVQLLRDSALRTFGTVQQLLQEAIFLGTYRLIEDGNPGGKRTASFESLFSYLPDEPATLRRRLKKRLNHVRTECEELRQWRHRQGAHRDEATVTMEHPRPLQPIQARVVRHALEFFADSLTQVSDELGFNLTYQLHVNVDRELDVLELIRRLEAARHL